QATRLRVNKIRLSHRNPQEGSRSGEFTVGRGGLKPLFPAWSGPWGGAPSGVKEKTGHRSTDKRYAGDNRLIGVKSSHRRSGLAPRCRFIASWGCRSSQGLGCSPIKAVRELGSERRETVRSLSVVGVGDLRGLALSTRGPG